MHTHRIVWPQALNSNDIDKKYMKIVLGSSRFLEKLCL